MGKRLPCPGQKLIDRFPTQHTTPTTLHPTPLEALALQTERSRRGKKKESSSRLVRGFLATFFLMLARSINHRFVGRKKERRRKRKKKKVPRYVNRQAITKDVRTSCPLSLGRAAVAAASAALPQPQFGCCAAGVIHDVYGVRLGRDSASLASFKVQRQTLTEKGGGSATQRNAMSTQLSQLTGAIRCHPDRCVINSTVTAHLSLLPYCAVSLVPALPACLPALPLSPLPPVDLHTRGRPYPLVGWLLHRFFFGLSHHGVSDENGRAPVTHRRQERASAGKKTGRPRAKLCRPWNINPVIPNDGIPNPTPNPSPTNQPTKQQHTHTPPDL